MCLCRCVEDGRWVAVGDDRGAVHLLRFPHAAAGLLTRPRSEGITALTWQVSASGTSNNLLFDLPDISSSIVNKKRSLIL